VDAYLVAVGDDNEVFLDLVAVFEEDDTVVGIYVSNWLTKGKFSFGVVLLGNLFGKLSQGSVEGNSMPMMEAAAVYLTEIAEYLLMKRLELLMINHLNHVAPNRDWI
jgi:hypothetical protein